MKNKLSLTILVVLALAAHVARAQDGFYLMGALGSSDSSVNLGGINRVDGNDDSYAVGVGYAFSNNFSIEAGYHGFGTQNAQTNCPPGFACILIPLRTEADVTGISLSLIGSIPVSDRFDVYGKIGLLSWDIDFSGISSAFNDSGEDLLYGVGLTWSMDERWKLFLEYSRVDLDVDAGNVGVRFSF